MPTIAFPLVSERFGLDSFEVCDTVGLPSTRAREVSDVMASLCAAIQIRPGDLGRLGECRGLPRLQVLIAARIDGYLGRFTEDPLRISLVQRGGAGFHEFGHYLDSLVGFSAHFTAWANVVASSPGFVAAGRRHGGRGKGRAIYSSPKELLAAGVAAVMAEKNPEIARSVAYDREQNFPPPDREMAGVQAGVEALFAEVRRMAPSKTGGGSRGCVNTPPSKGRQLMVQGMRD